MMKGRSLLVSIGLIVLILIMVCFSAWKGMSAKNVLNLQNQKVEIPESAQFFDKNNLLTVYFNVDPNLLPKYVEAVAPDVKRKNAKEESIKIRDGLFELTTLDYEEDLSDWIEPKLSFSILSENKEIGNYNWILALETTNSENANNFLTKFWEKKSLEGISVKNEKYKDLEMRLGFSNTSKRIENQIATALVDNKLTLIASDSNTLKESIDNSEKANENQLNDKTILNVVNKLDKGNALFLLSKEALNSWLEIPQKLRENNNLQRLIFSVRTTGPNLIFDSAFVLNKEIKKITNQTSQEFSLQNESRDFLEDIAILSEPVKLLSENSEETEAQLLGAILRKYIHKSRKPALNIIATLEKGPLLWKNQKSGWFIKTKNNLQEMEIEKSLEKDNYTKNILNLEKKKVNVWSKLNTKKIGDYNSINTEIGAILVQEDEFNLWSESIENIEQSQKNNGISHPGEKFEKINGESKPFFSQQIYLGPALARSELNEWKTWLLLQALIGENLEPHVENLAIGIGHFPDEELPMLNLRAKLTLG